MILKNNKHVSLNEGVIKHYQKNKKLKDLYVYSVCVFVTSGLGYMRIDKMVDAMAQICKVSSRNVSKWIHELEKLGYLKIKNRIVYVKSKRSGEDEFGTGRVFIRFFEGHLNTYSSFRDHIIKQLALLKQKRFESAFKFTPKISADSLLNSGKIETTLAFVSNKKRSGCSISQIEKNYGFDKKTISNALKGNTIKQFNRTKPICGKIVRLKYASLLKSITKLKSPECIRYSFDYNKAKDEYVFYYAISSRISVDSFLSKR